MNLSSVSLAKRIRKSSLAMVHDARASHIGSALSIADVLAVLYADIINFSSVNPILCDRDRFILSKGHACVALYAALSHVGFFDESLLSTYGKNNSDYMNHVSHKVPGVEFSTGSLGHGLPYAVGKALYAKTKGCDWNTFVLLSDGELDEGSNWEALLFAAHHRLDNLIIIVDYNNLQSLGTVSSTLNLEPILDKFTAFGCDPIMGSGHDHDFIRNTFNTFLGKSNGMPQIFIAKTIKGKGVSFMENQVLWHYRSPNDHELSIALSEIDNA